MSPESISSLIRRAERRIGRSFAGLNVVEVSAHQLRANGLRATRDENYGLIEVWELSFGRTSEVYTVLYGRTVEQAFDRAINPPKPRTRK